MRVDTIKIAQIAIKSINQSVFSLIHLFVQQNEEIKNKHNAFNGKELPNSSPPLVRFSPLFCNNKPNKENIRKEKNATIEIDLVFLVASYVVIHKAIKGNII